MIGSYSNMKQNTPTSSFVKMSIDAAAKPTRNVEKNLERKRYIHLKI